MKVTQEKLPASQVGLAIEVPAEQSKQAYEKVVQNLSRSAHIPGFRKGKVPRHILLQQYGQRRIKAAALEELLQAAIQQALEQEKLAAIGQFEITTDFEELINQFQPGESFTFSGAIDVKPEVHLTQYQGLQVKAEEVQYDPERVTQTLDSYRRQMATLVPVEDRPAQTDDVVVIDYVAHRVTAADPELTPEVEDANSIGQATDFQLDMDENNFIAGFVSGIIGMTVGETRDVTTRFPEDYPQADLANQEALFRITLKEIKLRELPEFNDDFAQEVSDFDTLAELQASLEERFKQEALQKSKANKDEALIEALVNQVQVDLPETLVEQEIQYLLEQTAMRLASRGLDIKQLFTAEMIPQMKAEIRPDAIGRLKQTLALSEISQREAIAVDPEAVEARVQELLAQYADDKLNPQRLRENVEDTLLREKVLQWLEERSQIELVLAGTLETEAAPSSAESPEALESAEIESSLEATKPESTESA